MAIRKAGDYLSEFAQTNNDGRLSDTPSAEKYPRMPKPAGKPVDTTVSDRTLRGDYNIDDSPEASAARLDSQVQQARKYNADHKNKNSIAQQAIDNADRNRYVNTEAIDERVASREMYNRDQGTIAFGDLFGDLWNNRGPSWKSAEPAKDVEAPDFEKMYDKYNPLNKD